MQSLRAISLPLALALCAILGPPAHAKPQPRDDRAPGIAPFTHYPGDDVVLAWARRWADQNLDDPVEHFAMLSYAISAAEARQVSMDASEASAPRNDNGKYDFDQSFGEMNIGAITDFTHLRHVNFLAELDTAAAPIGTALARASADEPEWSARHLCNGTLITPRWILTTAACISQPAARKGIEARLGARDLSQPDGLTRRVIRIVPNPRAGLALLELDAAAESEGAVTIAPPAGLTASEESTLSFGRVALPGWPRVLYRYSGIDKRYCAGDDGSPNYVDDLQQGPLLAGVLAVPRGAGRACPVAGLAGAAIVPVVAWASWIGKVTGVHQIVTEPHPQPEYVPQAH